MYFEMDKRYLNKSKKKNTLTRFYHQRKKRPIKRS